ncbi:heavy metal-binding domain-containing protein [Granulosicoccus antarcticus]|uniref:Silver exporting P-type ATPase n=1 Tax=Granulosicoccus antarcticus IMCC3135 TaxID=1192854 RepID=A0A2Z2NT52_9GAMM|nr:heavy metal-binding domain-containing protein [Granulosicoccus antarcticus]ASJ73705.1 Silver exporting P-type ATPase [Granulosicoccus antarcticus IMCC3135]
MHMKEKSGEFDVLPEGYVGAIYTCSMHSEVRHPGPGACPLCSMGLECVGLQGEGPDSELHDITRRLWVGIGLSVPLLVLSTNGQVGVFFEVAAVIVTLVLLGQVMELRACEGMGKAVRAMLDMAAKIAQMIRSDSNRRRDRA